MDSLDLAVGAPVPVATPWVVLVRSSLGPSPLVRVWPLPGSGPTCTDTGHQQVQYLKFPHVPCLQSLHGLAPAWDECLLSIVCGQCVLILQDSDQMSSLLGALLVPTWLLLPPLCSPVPCSYLDFRTDILIIDEEPILDFPQIEPE